MNPTAQDVLIPSSGLDMPAYHLVPAVEGDAAPAIIVVHDWHGRDETVQDAATRLAGQGYHVIVPDLFSATPPPEGADDAALKDFVMAQADSRVVSAVLAALEWTLRRPGVDAARVGVLGWGWGGAYALMAAGHDPRLKVAVDIGGAISYHAYTPKRPGSPLNFVANLEGALFAAFAGKDPEFPQMEVERLRGRLAEHGKRGDVKFYEDAPARFWRDASNPATELLWRRAGAFLAANLA